MFARRVLRGAERSGRFCVWGVNEEGREIIATKESVTTYQYVSFKRTLDTPYFCVCVCVIRAYRRHNSKQAGEYLCYSSYGICAKVECRGMPTTKKRSSAALTIAK